MKRYPPLVVLIALIAATTFAQAPRKPEVTASQLAEGQVEVIGVLGKPLGIRMTIKGKASTRPGKSEFPLLEVTAIDGKALIKPILVGVQGAKFKEGEEYTLEGYETGRFGSSAQWDSADSPQPVFFQFTTFFIVVPDNFNADGKSQ
jgi:hypothetical protein